MSTKSSSSSDAPVIAADDPATTMAGEAVATTPGDGPSATTEADAPNGIPFGALVHDTVYDRHGIATGYDPDGYPIVIWLGNPGAYTPAEPLEILGMVG